MPYKEITNLSEGFPLQHDFEKDAELEGIYKGEKKVKTKKRKTTGTTTMTTERKCLHCGSTNIRSKGLRKNSNGEFRRFLCDDCGQKCQIPLNLLSPTVEDQSEDKKPKIKMIEPYLEFRKEFPNAKGFVVTCAINDTGVNKPFRAGLS